jgi:hypothetical protein
MCVCVCVCVCGKRGVEDKEKKKVLLKKEVLKQK